MNSQQKIESCERFGKTVHQKGYVRRGRVNKGLFYPPDNGIEISVDQIWLMPLKVAIEIGVERGRNRNPPCNLLGWAVLTIEDVLKDGREILAKQEGDNLYHAHIVLPEDAIGNEDEKEFHAKELAEASCLMPYPLDA